MQKTLLVLVFVVISPALSYAQGTFRNLDFESAQVVFDNPPYSQYLTIATTNALPDWAAFAPTRGPGGITFTQQLSSINYGTIGTSPTNFPPVALIPAAGGLASSATIDGAFSVLLNGGFISQTGQVPADVQSLLFKAYTDESYLRGPVLVSLDGQSLPTLALLNVPTSQNIGYTLYGADISSFAGQSETLTFSGIGILDDIQFSSQPIPEPSAISLICLGSGVLFYVRKRKRS